MPALAAPFLGFALGVALAWLAGAEAARDDEGALARTLIAALFGALVFAPASGYFLAFAADWSFAYFVDSRLIPSAVLLLLAILDAAAVPLGFLAGRRAASRTAASRGLLPALVAIPALLALAPLLALFNRLRIEGTFHQVKSAFGTQPVAGGPLGYAILWMGAMIAGGFAVTLRALTRRARVAPTRVLPRRDDPPPPEEDDDSPFPDGAAPDDAPPGERRYLGLGRPGERRRSGR